MSEIETNAGPLGITVRYEGWYIAYFGSKEGLIAAGIATERMFPVGKQKRRSSRYLSKPQPGDPVGYFCCSLLPSGLYRVTLINPDFAHEFRSSDDIRYECNEASVIQLEGRRQNLPRRVRDRPGVVLAFPSGESVSETGRNGVPA